MAELLALRQIALQRDEYTVGWICALSEETAAAVSLLDEVHAPRPQPPTDSTSYRLGRISDHNIVIACPADGTGSQAATAATISRLMSNFPSIKFVLSVGIGSGVPSAGEDIRLGDVVVAMPNSTNSGLVQFDFGKQRPIIEQIPIRPPNSLLIAVNSLRRSPPVLDYAGPKPDGLEDILFMADHGEIEKQVLRDPRQSILPRIHYGTIATGNLVMKDGLRRDRISEDFGGVLCFEMEIADSQRCAFEDPATGVRCVNTKNGHSKGHQGSRGQILAQGYFVESLPDALPGLVIRGIADYADSHKTKKWHSYAAATAAAYAKELLSIVHESLPDVSRLDTNHKLASSHINNTASDAWLARLQNWSRQVTQPIVEVSSNPRAKVALLDTGYDSKHPVFNDPDFKGRIIDSRSWIPNEDPHGDDEGHGTHSLGLILRIAPTAEVFVARVIKSNKDEREDITSQIADAIVHAVKSWEVNIIVMPFGFRKEDHSIRQAIMLAALNGVLMFSPMSETFESRDPVMFPARLKEVIMIGSTDAYGNPSVFNPPFLRESAFAVLGESVPGPQPREFGDSCTLSGSSIATPIAAAIAAVLLDFVGNNSQAGILSASNVEHLRRQAGMESVFKAMSESRNDLNCITPWMLLDEKKPRTELLERIRRILDQSTGPSGSQPLDWPDDISTSDTSSALPSNTAATTVPGSSTARDSRTGVIKAITLLLLEDPVMEPLYPTCMLRLGVETFRQGFIQMIKRYAEQMGRDAGAQLEIDTAVLVGKRARAITATITNVVSSSDTAKVNEMSKLKKQLPATAELMSRYLDQIDAPLAAAGVPGQPQQATQTITDLAVEDVTDIEEGIDVEDEELEEAGQEPQDLVDNLSKIKEFLTSSAAFRLLREDMRIFTFPSIPELIRSSIEENVAADVGIITITCTASWEVFACCKTELEKPEDLDSVVTITGSQSYAQATSCGDYMRQTWPRTGGEMLNAMIQFLKTRQYRTTFGGWHYLDMNLTAANKKGGSETAVFEISGTMSEIAETMEQLAWLAATFRKPSGNHLTSSYTDFRPAIPFDRDDPKFDLLLLSPRQEQIKARNPGNCWTTLLRESVLAHGFPVAHRKEGLGLDVPFHLMTYLAGIQYPMEYRKGIVFRGLGNDLGFYPMLIPTKKLEDAMQWHYIQAHADTSKMTNIDIAYLKSLDVDNAWFQSMEIDTIIGARAVLGFCNLAQVQIGTESFLSKPIERSNLLSTGHSLEIILEGTASVSPSAKGFFTAALTSKWVVRRPQRAVIPGAELPVHTQIHRAIKQPIMLYDTKADRAWLVSELSVALHLAHTYLSQEPLTPSVKKRLRFAEAECDGGTASKTAIDACGGEAVLEEYGKEIVFRDVVAMFLRIVECWKDVKKDPGPSIAVIGSKAPQGWDFEDLQTFRFLVEPKMIKPENRPSTWRNVWAKVTLNKVDPLRSWLDLAKEPSLLVLVGTNFGQVITPDGSHPVCKSWASVPEGQGLFTASMPCLLGLSERANNLEVLKQDLHWHQPRNSTLFQECVIGRPCNPIQELRKPSPTTTIKAPVRYMWSGAVMFGDFPRGQLRVCDGALQPEVKQKRFDWVLRQFTNWRTLSIDVYWLVIPVFGLAFFTQRQRILPRLYALPSVFRALVHR